MSNIHENAVEKAITLFESGCNCSQAVFAAFAPGYGLPEKTALMIASGFGGGLAQTRDVCGAVTGMFMAAGLAGGFDVTDKDAKEAFYVKLREMEAEFRGRYGTNNCKLLLERVEGNGQKRPCSELVRLAAEITQRFLANTHLP
ncbi:MAG: C-GCAxxG-C-C family protein [Oscillospiraceae bacterium]|nr:C-GCAxxG-C-C family protein [Oscillospiraceae bacterium]